jgi:hypothetical protein
MGKKHKRLTNPLKSPLSYLIEHDCQGKGKQSGKYQKKKIEVEGIPDNHTGGVTFKEKLKILQSVKRTAKNPQAVIETLKSYDNIRIGTVSIYKSIENGRQQQHIPVRMNYNIVNKPFLL